MPAHTHSFYIPIYTDVVVQSGTGNGSMWGGNQPPVQVGSTGGGAAHNNLQPYLTMHHIIKT